MVNSKFSLLLVLLLVCDVQPVCAEPKAAAGGDVMLKKAQGMLRQLTQEKAALETEKSAWLNEKAELDTKVEALSAAVVKLAPLQDQVERYKSGIEALRSSLESQLQQEREAKQSLQTKHNEVLAKARDIQSDNLLLVQAVQEREQWISQCTERNNNLQQLNREVLTSYQEKGLLQHLAELEPLTGIARVQTESTSEDYRYKLTQLKITPFQPTASVTSPATANGTPPEPKPSQGQPADASEVRP